MRGSSTVEFVPTEPVTGSGLRGIVAGAVADVRLRRTAYAPLRAFAHRPPYRRLWMARTGHYLEFPPTIGHWARLRQQPDRAVQRPTPETGGSASGQAVPYCSAASPTLPGLGRLRLVPAPAVQLRAALPSGRRGAVTAKKGKLVWQRPIASESTPFVVGRLVYVGGGTTGSTRSMRGRAASPGPYRDQPARSTARPRTRAGRSTSATTGGQPLRARRPDGRRAGGRWSSSRASGRAASTSTRRPPSPTAASTREAPTARCDAYGAATGHLLWAKHRRHVRLHRHLGVGGELYVGTYDGRFYALDAATGDVRWVWIAVGSIHGAPTVMAGLVYFATLRHVWPAGSATPSAARGTRFSARRAHGEARLDVPRRPLLARRRRLAPRLRGGLDAGLRLTPAGGKKRPAQPQVRPRPAARRGTTSGTPAR